MSGVEAGVSIGSNLGDRVANLRAARAALGRMEGAVVTGCASLYETEPQGVAEEFRGMAYCNSFLTMETELGVREFFRRMRKIETSLGRTRSGRANEPRGIDIDLIYFGEERLEEEGLTVPHPRWSGRRFVAGPLAELRPWLRLPGCGGRSVAEVFAALPEAGQGMRVVAREW